MFVSLRMNSELGPDPACGPARKPLLDAPPIMALQQELAEVEWREEVFCWRSTRSNFSASTRARVACSAAASLKIKINLRNFSSLYCIG